MSFTFKRSSGARKGNDSSSFWIKACLFLSAPLASFSSSIIFEEFMELDRCKTYAYLNQEDFKELQRFKENFLSKSALQAESNQLIPSMIHMIWVGPKEFPEHSLSKMESWKRHHPNWKFIFWTDRSDRLPPIQDAEVRCIDDYDWNLSAQFLEETVNPAEKSDLLRYEILYRWGGIYTDHDIECFAPFDSLQNRFSLFAFLEPPHYIPGYPLGFFPNNGLIGSAPNNPIIKNAMDEVTLRWKNSKNTRFSSTFAQVLYRTFQPFTIAIRNQLEDPDSKAIIFPAAYLYPPEHIRKSEFELRIKEGTLFANHSNDGLWFKKPIKALNRKEAFESIYKNDEWGFSPHRDPFEKRFAKPYLDWLSTYLDQHPLIETVLDIGCSDSKDFENFDWKGRNYIGVDIVESVLPFTTRLKGTKSTIYLNLDFLDAPLPAADLIICKDVLMHLCDEDVKKALNLFRKYEASVIVNDTQNKILRFLVNSEIPTGRYRCLDLCAFPYFLEPKDIYSYETAHSIKEILLFEKN